VIDSKGIEDKMETQPDRKTNKPEISTKINQRVG
jgi:hypothetical protein